MSKYAFTPKNCWDVYNTPADKKKMEELAARYMDFLTNCKTERETTEYVVKRLGDLGFPKSGVKGDKLLKTIQGKAVVAARRGTLPLSKGLHLIFAHTDTPRLDLKQHPLQEQSAVAQMKTHYYGGIRKYQWFARPLALHGVVVKDNGQSVNIVLGENPSEPVLTINDLLPHLAQKQNDLVLRNAFEAEKMNLIIGHEPARPAKAQSKKDEAPAGEAVKARVLELLNKKYGIVEEDLYSAELQAVPAGPARTVGLDEAIIGGYGQDDRINVFLGLEAFIAGLGKKPQHTQILVFLDKEEIGSEGSTGAKSRFFEYCVQDLLKAWEPAGSFADVMLNSRALSADVHAATDPDWQDLHEKLNAAVMGYGPCFCKFTGSRGKYEANDAHAEYVGWLRGILNKAGIPWQMAELGKVDGGGGGTVAMFFASYGMNVIDCGPAVLSMHSPFELSSKVDLYATFLAFQEFLNAK